MSKQFYVWKDRNCNGVDPEWVQLTGREYFSFVSDPGNEGRYFVVLGDDGDENAGEIYMEVTPEDYRKWKNESRVSYRRQRRNAPYVECQRSLDETVGEDEELALHELVADENANLVEQAFHNLDLSTLREAMKSLDSDEIEIVSALYFSNQDQKSDRKIAQLLNLSPTTLNYRKIKTLQKLKNFFVQNGSAWTNKG